MRFAGAWRGTTLAAALSLVAAGLLAPAAATPPAGTVPSAPLAAPGWSEPVAVSGPGDDVWDLEIALHRRLGLAAWVAPAGEGTHVLTARQRPDGTWAAPAPVAGTGGASEVEVAHDRRGRARLVWTAGRRVQTLRLRADGTTSRPRLLHRTMGGPLGTRPSDLRLAGNAGGAAVVVWQTMDDDQGPPSVAPQVQAVVRGAGGWGGVRTLSSPGVAATGAEVFLSRSGRTTVVWREGGRGSSSVWRTSHRPSAGWGTARSFTPRGTRASGTRAGSPRLAGRPGGRLVAAYAVRAGQRRGLAVRQWTRKTGWSRPVLVRGARPSSRLALGLSAQSATAAFTDRRGRVRVASVSRTGQVSRTPLTPDHEVFDGLRLATNRAGDALVAWDSVRGGDHPVVAAYRPAAGEWGPVTTVSAEQGDSFLGALSVRGDGQALALWSTGEVGTPGTTRAWARSYVPAQQPQCDISARGVPACGAYAGAAYGSNSHPQRMEAEAGQRLGLRRTFWQANEVGPAVRTARADIAAGRLPWISFKLPTSWEAMAAGSGDAWAVGIARRLARLKGPVWVAFHHEPEKDGDITAWRQMQERLGPIVRETAPNVGFTVILTGWNQWYGPAQYRIENVWPRTTVDVAGFDVYNFHLSVRKDGSWITEPDRIAADYFTKISAWAQSQGVAWGLAETGQTDESFAVDPEWMPRTFGELVAHGGVAMAYFNTPLNNFGSSWPLASRAKQQAWGVAMARGVRRGNVPRGGSR